MLTKLLTIRMVANSRSGRSSRAAALCSDVFFEFLKVSRSDLVRENKAVSDPDIRAEIMNSNKRTRM